MPVIWSANISCRLGAGGGLLEQGNDLLVINLRKVFIELADSPEFFRGEQIDQVVTPVSDFFHPFRRNDGNGDDDLARFLRLDRLKRRDHGGAGGDAVVGHDDGAAHDWGLRPNATDRFLPALDLGKLVACLFHDVIFGQVREFFRVVVEIDTPVLADGTDRQLRLFGACSLRDRTTSSSALNS